MYSAQKKNFKNLTVFLFLTFLFLFFNETTKAQNPVSFTVTGCTTGNGDYIQGEDFNNCTCCERADGSPGVIAIDNGVWIYDDAHSDCATVGSGGSGGEDNPDGRLQAFASIDMYNYVDCNILNATSNSCDPGAITNVIYSAGDVPTLSEWGLIILALLFMSFGTIAILQHKTSKIEGD